MSLPRYKRIGFQLTAAATAILALPALQAAESNDVTDLTKPESTVQAGLGYVNHDNRRFGQYTGLNEKGAYGLLDVDVVRRDDDSGTWFRVTGRNLGLDDRDLRLEQSHQGDWGYFIDFSQIPRFEPFKANTGVSGIGSANLIVNGEAPRDVQLKTERDRLTLGFEKWLQGGFSFDLRFRNEQKDGTRIFARGTTGGAGLFQFTPEPIDSITRQLDATVNYTGDRLQLSGGYYGTMFDNHNTALNITEAGAATGLAGFTPIALPPDNQSHQLFMSGGYSFTPTTRGTFKLAYARQTQDDPFILPSATGRTDLGGRVDTLAWQMGVTARPAPKLSLLANLRYEDRHDKTPVVDYFPITVTTTATGENEPRSIRTTFGKLEASYRLPADFRLTAGFDDDIKKRNTSSVRVVSFRETTDEKSYRLELRRSMSETVTGALALIHSARTGSDFVTTTETSGATGSNLIAPLHLADRDRNKVRASVNWVPTEPLSLQFLADHARDEFTGRDNLNLGARSGTAAFYSVDATYTFSEKWQANAWISRNDNQIDQATCVAASAAGVCPASAAQPIWGATLRNQGDAVGAGVRAKLTSKVDTGVELQLFNFHDEFRQSSITAGGNAPSLPDIGTKRTSLKLYTTYALQRNAGMRVDYIYDRFYTDDWTWANFTYTDGTQLSQPPKQTTQFIGLSYYYRW